MLMFLQSDEDRVADGLTRFREHFVLNRNSEEKLNELTAWLERSRHALPKKYSHDDFVELVMGNNDPDELVAALHAAFTSRENFTETLLEKLIDFRDSLTLGQRTELAEELKRPDIEGNGWTILRKLPLTVHRRLVNQ
ncbi:hypothetical protein R0135_00855 [Congregibacter variabilis]|uniref:Uncharacterized protein n=1 Tax=Congregibacter variabilis TaxID=3081200 RepID=A0ABZ0I3H3_9GAMM|nr:hypothetical protein R0135_00855 [Congregibacter sp. IMCC43200]